MGTTQENSPYPDRREGMGKNVFPRIIVFPQPPFGPAVGYLLHWSLAIENRSKLKRIRLETTPGPLH
jgi:hypothetical protein